MRHLAVIMDGNGRWAVSRGRARLQGHKAGADALERVMGYCRDAGIRYLTVYAFSTENWKRPAREVSGLMRLLSSFVKSKARKLARDGVRFRTIGRLADFPEKLRSEIAALERKTAGGDFTLTVALSYGGRAEIVDAANKWLASNPSGPVDEKRFSSFMYAPDIPDPDLVIRTSGEVRTSNFLMWETAYSEWYFTDVLWPDFGKEEFDKALESYSKRERRMGGIHESDSEKDG